jgi:apolipoprotein N-acyltransferase
MTPFVRFGNYTMLVLAVLALAGAWFLGRKYAKRSDKTGKKID